jgi:hypothetical protein
VVDYGRLDGRVLVEESYSEDGVYGEGEEYCLDDP